MARRKPQPKSFPLPAVIAIAFAIVLALGGSGVKWPDFFSPPGPVDPVPAVVAGDPNLLAAFTAGVETGHVKPDAARQDAADLAEISLQIAECLEYDGTLAANDRCVETGVSVSAFRFAVRNLATRGSSFALKYPLLKTSIAEYLDKAAGTDPGDMTAEQRKKWVDAHRAIYRACKYAESKL